MIKSQTNSNSKITNCKTRKFWSFGIGLLFIVCNLCIVDWNSTYLYAEETKKAQAIIVNGDRVEYITETKEFTATGNVEVNYGGTKLTCDKLTLNTQTKEGTADGNARLEEGGGIVEGEKLIYNFNNKKGTIIGAEFRSNPYFGRAQKLDKVSDDEFIIRRGYMTTCSYDNPHYRIKSKRVNFFPGNKVQMRDNLFFIRDLPLLYIPQYNHSLRDPVMHIQLMPGKRKDWGMYLLTASRYELTEDVIGRIYLDYRTNWGIAEGFAVNYKSTEVGKGNFKFYYTQERDKSNAVDQEDVNAPKVFERYMIRWRHKYDMDKFTNAILEYYKIKDAKRAIYGDKFNFLKDYFYREYELDSRPLSYISLHRSFDYASVDLLLQKRTNDWYSQGESLPEIKFTLPHIRVANSPFYFENTLYYQKYAYKTAVPADGSNDANYNKYETTNKLSLPARVAFLTFNPYAGANATIYDKNDVYGSTAHIAYVLGSDLSTKFYRFFNIKSNFLGLNINDLRHIITPTAAYSYANTSTTPTGKAKLGGSSAIGNSGVTLELENRLQTKRGGQKIDLATFSVTTTYNIQSKVPETKPGAFSDFILNLEVKPYSWLRIEADATYKHTNSSNINYNKFSDVNYDINFDFGTERTIGVGQRYQRKGGNDLTASFEWRFSPKWKFNFYQSHNMSNAPGAKKGLREQEYALTRDFHCWIVALTYNVKRGFGESVWLILRLKAFPEMEFEYNQDYHQPKPGSQAN